MTHILVECPAMIASVRVGVLDPLRYFEQAGLCEVRFYRTLEVSKEALEWCDVYICVRGFEDCHVRLVNIAKESGRAVIYFLDDDLANMPPDIPSADFLIRCNGSQNIRAILQRADALWVVNAHLGEKYRDWCNRVVVSRVPVSLSPERMVRQIGDTLRVLYAGSTDHTSTIQEQLTPAIERLLADYPGRFSFTFIGANPGVTHKKVRYYPFFDQYEAYKQTVRDGNFSVGLAPIKSGEFYEHKYYNKFIEYASEGIVGIYANRPPYTLVVRDGQNGYLTGHSPAEWYQALLRVWDSRDTLATCAENAAELLCTQYSHEIIGRQLREDMGDLLLRKRRTTLVRWPRLSVRNQYLLSRIRYHFQRYQILAIPILGFKFVRWIWLHVILRRF